MMTTATTNKKELEIICIDLPGEAIQCTGDNIKVILRKHRDVIFDINHGDHKIYTVEATDSDFYNVRDKKLIFKERQGTVAFVDGERLHLRVSRGFKGALLLKFGGQIVMRIEPNKLDTHQYGNDPKEKPAPIIITLGSSKAAHTNPLQMPAPLKSHFNLFPPTPLPFDIATKTPLSNSANDPLSEKQEMLIVEVKKTNVAAPPSIMEFMKKGGEDSILCDNDAITRNWLLTQIVSVGLDTLDNAKLIAELKGQKLNLQKVMHKSGPKWYITFKGTPGLRNVLTAARYGVAHPKVLTITGGMGSAKSMGKATLEAGKGGLKKGGVLAIVFIIAIDIAEWLNDYEQKDPITGKPKKDFIDLAVKIGIDLAKAFISAALATLAVGAVIAIALGLGFGAVVAAVPVGLIIVGTIVVTFLIGLGLDLIENEFKKKQEKLNKSVIKTVAYLEGGKHASDYQGYQNALNLTALA